MATTPFISEVLSPYLGQFSDYSIELILLVVILSFILLILYTFTQIGRYKNLKRWLGKNLEETRRQEAEIRKIAEDTEKYKKAQEGLDYWGDIKEELVELSKLPSIEESENEIILRIHVSKLKKEKIDVTATDKEINVNLYEGQTPLKCVYSLPSKIDPNKLIISYKGNTLEIKAQKV